MIQFNNLEVAFSDKCNSDLNRSHLLFKTISSPVLSKLLTSVVKICLWLKLPITPIIKATVFKHFCGGTTIKNSQKVMDKLWESHIGTILDYSAEGKKSEEDCNHVMEETIRTILKSRNEENIPFSVFKFTGLCSFSLLEKMSGDSVLTKKEEVEKGLFLSRIETICRTAAENKVPIFIDAEESWIQNAIDNITMEMMRKYNKEEACIYNTLQMYRNDRITYLNELVSDIKDNKYFVGLKLVRGAYHDSTLITPESSWDPGYPDHDIYDMNPPTVQTTNGSNDFIFYSFFFRDYQKQKLRIFITSLFVRKGYNSLGMKFGDYSSLGIFASKTVYRKWGITGQLKAETIGEMKSAENIDLLAEYSIDKQSTGSKKLFLVPQLSYSQNGITVFVTSEIPLYQYLNGTQVGSQNQFTVGVNYRFLTRKCEDPSQLLTK